MKCICNLTYFAHTNLQVPGKQPYLDPSDDIQPLQKVINMKMVIECGEMKTYVNGCHNMRDNISDCANDISHDLESLPPYDDEFSDSLSAYAASNNSLDNPFSIRNNRDEFQQSFS